MSSDHTYLGAVVGPYAAWVIVRDFPEVLRSLEAKGRSLVCAGQEQAGRQMLAAVAQVREAGRQRHEGYLAERSVGGPPKGPRSAIGAALKSPPGSGLTTGEVAVSLEVGQRQVRKWIAGQKLTATTVGRQHFIDEESVAELIEQRRERRERRGD